MCIRVRRAICSAMLLQKQLNCAIFCLNRFIADKASGAGWLKCRPQANIQIYMCGEKVHLSGGDRRDVWVELLSNLYTY